MPLRKLVDHLEYRTQIWRFAIRVLREVHNQRFPSGRNFGRDLDLVVAYGFAFISISKHGRVRLSTLSQQLGMPLETARRKLHQLVELGLLRRDGRDFRLGPVAMKMSSDMKRIMEDQLRRAVRIAHNRTSSGASPDDGQSSVAVGLPARWLRHDPQSGLVQQLRHEPDGSRRRLETYCPSR